MQRNFLRGFLICLIPCLVAAVFAAPVRVEKNAEGRKTRVTASKYRLGIDLAGGTILVYEVNLARTQQRKELLKSPQERNKDKEQEKGCRRAGDTASAQGLTSEEINALAAQIKRRIDPTDIKNVTVRPSGDRRIEIILPTGGGTSGRASLTNEEIEEVKRLISQMGVLEFRILANGPDDNAGITGCCPDD